MTKTETPHRHDPEKCRFMFEKLSEYIDNELDALTCRDIERHAQDCIACQVCLGTLKKTIELCKKMETEPVPEIFSEKLREFIRKHFKQDGL
jgi:anti-sigma factor RsiW